MAFSAFRLQLSVSFERRDGLFNTAFADKGQAEAPEGGRMSRLNFQGSLETADSVRMSLEAKIQISQSAVEFRLRSHIHIEPSSIFEGNHRVCKTVVFFMPAAETVLSCRFFKFSVQPGTKLTPDIVDVLQDVWGRNLLFVETDVEEQSHFRWNAVVQAPSVPIQHQPTSCLGRVVEGRCDSRV